VTAPRRFLHLAVLSAFALAQPLFDVLERSPEFFAVRGSARADVIVFGVALTIVPPVALVLLELAAGLMRKRVAVGLHLVFVAGLSGLLALQAVKRAGDLPPGLLVALSALLGVCAAALYWKAGAARTILTVLAPAPLLFLGLFLARSPIGSLDYAGPAHAGSFAGARTPIVMVIFDELPVTSLMDASGQIDAARYPSFAALARSSSWYRNTLTVHGFTPYAVPAILTGDYPSERKLPLVSDQPANLFTLLGRRYSFDVYEGVTRLCPKELCGRAVPGFGERMRSLTSDLGLVYLHVLLPKRLADGLPSVTQTWVNFGGKNGRPAIGDLVGRELSSDQRVRFESFVRSIAPRQRPALYFIHVLLPHVPWHYLPSGKEYANDALPGLSDERWSGEPWLVEQGFQRHLLQVEYVDRLLGELLARLRGTGLYDRSLVVVTADHGVSFRTDDSRRGPTKTNLQDIAFVPLFVKAPGQRAGKVVEAPISTIDILPTLAALLGARLPSPVDGRTEVDPGPGRRTAVVLDWRFKRLAVDAAVLEARRDATLARQVELFGSGAGGPGLYGLGPHRELVGRSVAGLAVLHSPRWKATLDQRDVLRSVDLGSVFLPVLLTGRLEGAPPGTALALAVNGRVVAVAKSFRYAGATRFSALVPESALRAGANSVAIYAVSGPAGALRLERLGGM